MDYSRSMLTFEHKTLVGTQHRLERLRYHGKKMDSGVTHPKKLVQLVQERGIPKTL